MTHHPNHPHHHSHGTTKRPLHKDWRAWLVVLLMLGGMLIYVASFDESEGPGGQPQPAMAGDAAG
jgi:hypothetical protein